MTLLSNLLCVISPPQPLFLATGVSAEPGADFFPCAPRLLRTLFTQRCVYSFPFNTLVLVLLPFGFHFFFAMRCGGAALLCIIACSPLVQVNFLALDFDLTILDIHTSGRWPGTPEQLTQRIRPFFQALIPAAVAAGE